MSKRLNQQKLPEPLLLRMWLLSNQKKPLIVRINDKVIFEFNIGELINVKEGKLNIELGEAGLKTKGNLVGMSGLYYSPELFGGGNVQNVHNSWDWFMKKIPQDPETFQNVLEAESVLELLLAPIEEGLLYYFLSLVVDLYELDSLGVDLDSKITELRRQVKGHMRKYEKLKDKTKPDALSRIRKLRLYLADLSSECRLAKLAKLYGFNVKLGIHPDLTIDGRKIEVKRVRRKYNISKSEVTLPLISLSNPIKQGLRQNADIVAIDVNNLEKRNIKGFKTVWLGRTTLKNALQNALAYRKNGNYILLFLGTNKDYYGRIILLKK